MAPFQPGCLQGEHPLVQAAGAVSTAQAASYLALTGQAQPQALHNSAAQPSSLLLVLISQTRCPASPVDMQGFMYHVG